MPSDTPCPSPFHGDLRVFLLAAPRLGALLILNEWVVFFWGYYSRVAGIGKCEVQMGGQEVVKKRVCQIRYTSLALNGFI